MTLPSLSAPYRRWPSAAAGAGFTLLELVVVMAIVAVLALIALGVAGAAAGGANLRRGGLRVAIGGVLAMIITFGVGRLFGTATG